MGRGRAKAKQVKVARQLKYNGGGTDLDRLRNELGIADRGEEVLADGAANGADGFDDDDDGFADEDADEDSEDG
jgi:hypothetical protein